MGYTSVRGQFHRVLRERDGNFFAQFVDGDNRRRELRLDARNRREAALMLAELEQRSRRQRQGLEPVVSRDDNRTVTDLMAHWVECLKGSAYPFGQGRS